MAKVVILPQIPPELLEHNTGYAKGYRNKDIFVPMSKSYAPSRITAHLGLLTVALLYGGNYFLAKVALAEISPMAAVAIRGFVGIIVFWTFHALVIKEKITDKKDFGLLVLCALFGVVINQQMFLLGLSKTTPINAGVLMITTPVFVFLIGFATRKEKITWYKLLGLLLAFLGAFFLVQMNKGEKVSFSSETLQGDLSIIVNAISYAVYLVMVKSLIVKYNTFTIVKWLFIIGGGINVLIGLPALVQLEIATVSWEAWGGMAFLVIGATLIAYFANAWSMKRVQPSAVGVYIFVQPVFVTLVTLLLFAGEVTWQKGLTILGILAGVYLLSLYQPRKPVENQ